MMGKIVLKEGALLIDKIGPATPLMAPSSRSAAAEPPSSTPAVENAPAAGGQMEGDRDIGARLTPLELPVVDTNKINVPALPSTEKVAGPKATKQHATKAEIAHRSLAKYNLKFRRKAMAGKGMISLKGQMVNKRLKISAQQHSLSAKVEALNKAKGGPSSAMTPEMSNKIARLQSEVATASLSLGDSLAELSTMTVQMNNIESDLADAGRDA
jgi:hypothetical protein